MQQHKVGLLPLYLKFYDEVLPDLAAKVAPFVQRVQEHLNRGGLDVVVSPIGRTRPDFTNAVERFETEGVDAIITLHLAYSPSLESAEVLAQSRLPIIMLDTTPDRDFGGHVDPMRLLDNHGIHGVQDLASVLRRLGKPYRVVAGHLDDPGVIERCVEAARSGWCPAFRRPATQSRLKPGHQQAASAERAAQCLRSMRVLRIGGMFPGMGDFAVSDEVLQHVLGITVENIEPAGLADAVNAISEDAVAAEIAADRKQFRVECDEAVHARSVRIGLGLRQCLEHGGFGAFSLNFLAFKESTGPVNSVPFLECCKAMARGTGYAGEGDALTAALVGALLQGFGAATFTEMFCPDWAGQSLFLSHMGEINPAIAAAQPLLYEKEYPFSPALNPATLACAPRPGRATLVNLAPGPNDSFRLITAPVEVLADGTHPDLNRWVRGWIRPALPLARFLEEFSHLGGTHHSALVFGDHVEALAAFSALLKIEHCNIS
jgi:L-arabinose isomerase